MKKLNWMVLILIFLSLYCFAISYFYITSNNNKSKPEILVETTPTTGFMTWYTSTPQIFAERMTNTFKIKTGIEVKIIRNSTFIVREILLSEIKNGKTKADVVSIADIGTYIELKNQGHLMKYSSPQYKHYPEKYIDPDY